MFKEKCLKKKIFREMFKEKRVGNLRKKKVDFSNWFSGRVGVLEDGFLRRLNKKQKIKAPQPDSIDQIKRLS